jgi:predicted double-glycine peptidase
MTASLFRKLVPLFCGSALALLGAGAANAQINLVDGGVAYSMKITTYKDIPFRTVVRQQYDFSCGSAALATLLNYHYSKPITEAEVFKAMYAVGDKAQIRQVGFSLLDMKRYLESRGMQADGYRTSLGQLEHADTPAIAVIVIGQYRHFVVIKGVRGGKVLIGDPAQGLKTYSEADFSKMWNGIIFAIHPRDGVKAGYNRAEEWSVWPNAPLGEPLSTASLSGLTRELPPLYQVSTFREIDPLGTAQANALATQGQ